MKCTAYFVRDVLAKRPYLSEGVCRTIIAAAVRCEPQPDGRIRHYGYDANLGKWLRVITLADGETLHNAFPDRGFKP